MASDDDTEIISEGPTSTVTRIGSKSPEDPRSIAIKTSSTTYAKEPHDIIKEVRILASLSHPNIVPVIKHELSSKSQNLSLWMPYIPYSLDELLQSSRFSPHPIISFEGTTSPSPTPREVQFLVVTKSIIFQVLCGVNYLHSEHVQIAHRDIKPSNVLLTPSGRAQLIDFGVAFCLGEDDDVKSKDLWPESMTHMYFEVSTGPYRAPELLFGPRTYDAFAVDAWSLGTTFAEFFTSLRLQTEDEDEDFSFRRSDRTPESESESGSSTGPRVPTPPPAPFVIPRGTRPRPGVPTGRWSRTSLFDGTRGEIGLAWSIFKVLGTPNAETWPSFLALPDANKLSFIDVPATDLASHLPNLPPSSSSPSTTTTPPSASLCTTDAASASPDNIPGSPLIPTPTPTPTPLDLVAQFLVYEPALRYRPAQALGHPWFRAEPGLVLPTEGESIISWASETEALMGTGTVAWSFTVEGHVRTLGDLLKTYIAGREH